MMPAAPGPGVPEYKRNYWRYQYELARLYLIPLLREWGIDVRGRRVLDVGCAEGGVLVACIEEGAEAIGLELSPSRAELAKILAAERGIDLRVHVGDVLDPGTVADLPRPFDLVILRDVLEHVSDRLRALLHVRHVLDPEHGRALISFPPFYSPFGGHQQMLGSRFRLLPYWHILPDPVFRWLASFLRKMDRQPYILDEMVLFRRDRLSLGRFQRLIRQAGLEVVDSVCYLSRPSHKLRYGWPVIRAGVLGRLPVVRELLVSGAYYLLAVGGDAASERPAQGRDVGK
ncbi:MAG: class I SAM-dependent methyltransferase [candidate division KSB1 bacterium]|nr:class I SAM-dependent methyltransferase [candidate division KSB1 bacterium]